MRVAAILAITGMSLCSTLALSNTDEIARSAAVQWLQLVDAGKYQEAAAQTSQEVGSLEQWLSNFASHRAPLGRANKRESVDVKHQSTFTGAPEVRRYYVIRFKTSFERKPAATEEIVLSKTGCCWEIFEYKVE